MDRFDVIIIGAGAAGMFCAIEAARRGRRVMVVEHAKAVGEKIRISGGGRCNFTNLHISPERFLSQNPKFALSALTRFSQWDFIDRVDQAGIAWHEKTLGQLFCDGSARQINDMLLTDLADARAELCLNTTVEAIRTGREFEVLLNGQWVTSEALVVACGGKSIPKMGATGFGYQIAAQFDVPLTEIRPALVPLRFSQQENTPFAGLAGTSLPASVACNGSSFDEALLFTHRGLSGPSILQISSYWREGDTISLNLVPGRDVFDEMKKKRRETGRQGMKSVLADMLPKRLAEQIVNALTLKGNLADQSDAALRQLADVLSDRQLKPEGSEGYRTAEVTLGGVDTDALDPRSMEVRAMPGLYFIGEVVDVTGWLGGYNFQWAWSSGWVAGQVV